MKFLSRIAVTALLTSALGLGAMALRAFAGANEDAVIMIHLATVSTKNECTRVSAHLYCNSTITAGSLYPTLYFAYLLVARGNPGPGIAGLECGISYDAAPHSGVDVYSWNLCADTEAPVNGWPASGGGNSILWNSGSHCQRNEPGGSRTGVVATAGYFYCSAYTPDLMFVTRNPASNQATLLDCHGNIEVIAPTSSGWSHLGFANFTASGLVSGWNPCSGGCLDCGGPRIDCNMTGPATCIEQTTVDFTTTVGSIGSAFSGVTWAVTGPAHFVGPTAEQATVHVHADAPGAVRVECFIDGGYYGGQEHCGMNLAVLSAVPVERVTWGGIKALYRTP